MTTEKVTIEKGAAKKIFPEESDLEKIWSGDELNRRKYAEILSRIISNQCVEKESFTIMIKSPWGSGKTFFVKKWSEHLKAHGCFCVYFSAWEAEIYESPIKYFLDTFMQAFDEHPELHSKIAKTLKKLFLAFMKVSLLTARIIKLPDFIISPEKIKNEAHDAVKEWVQDIEKADESPAELLRAREFLEETINDLESSEFKNKVFIFVDELDRCKPLFTINLIEVLKHFFSIKGMAFILSVDLEQLEGSIKHVYGNHINCEGYLMRFINLFYRLPPSDNFSYAKYLRKRLPEKLPDCLSGILPNSRASKILLPFEELFAKFSDAFGTSLREQERIIDKLNFMLPEPVFLLPTLYFLFVQLHFPNDWQRFYKDNLILLSLRNLSNFLIKENRIEKELTVFIRDDERTRPVFPDDLDVIRYNHDFENLLYSQIELLVAINASEKEFSNTYNKIYQNQYKNVYRWMIEGLLNNDEIKKGFSRQIELINLYSDNIGYKVAGS